jgi:phage host-nuclease inhibitor protein Gam
MRVFEPAVTVESREGLQLAVSELAHCHHLINKNKAQCAAELAAVTATWAAKQRLKLRDGQVIDAVKRAEQLEEAVITFVERQGDELFEDGKKSIKLMDGEVGLRLCHPKVEFRARCDSKTAMAAVEQAIGLAARLMSFLFGLKVFGGVAVGWFCVAKVEFSKSTLNANIDKFSDEQLRSLGLKRGQPRNEGWVKTHEPILAAA